jgi:manganese/zinc/iron transport system permease protein
MDIGFLQLTFVPALIGILAAVCCALPGNFLLLRRQALIADAISHVALPGIVGAFLLTGLLTGVTMLAGAALAALVAVLLIEAIRRAARIEPGAAMGVVFTAMFAGGVLLLEQSRAANIHLDADHFLFGNLESLVWLAASDWGSLVDGQALAELPEELPRLALVLLGLLTLGTIFWRPLVASSFDETFAAVQGLPVRAIGLGLVICAAVAAVSAFEAVGPILAIAMFICPPAAARLMTNRLPVQVALSAVFAAFSAITGFWLSSALPGLFAHPHAVSAAGMIATVAGLVLATACLLGPARSRLISAGATAPITERAG